MVQNHIFSHAIPILRNSTQSVIFRTVKKKKNIELKASTEFVLHKVILSILMVLHLKYRNL